MKKIIEKKRITHYLEGMKKFLPLLFLIFSINVIAQGGAAGGGAAGGEAGGEAGGGAVTMSVTGMQILVIVKSTTMH